MIYYCLKAHYVNLRPEKLRGVARKLVRVTRRITARVRPGLQAGITGVWVRKEDTDKEDLSNTDLMEEKGIDNTGLSTSFHKVLRGDRAFTSHLCQTAPPVCDAQTQAHVRSSAKYSSGKKTLLFILNMEAKANNQAESQSKLESKSSRSCPSVGDLEQILHSAPRSCHHGDEVWPDLYLGDMFMSHDKFGLWQLGVTHVLNASHGKLCCKGSDDFYGTTVKYYGVPANDLPTFELSPFFYPAAEFIHQALTTGGKVLVHCAVGVSRSAALVLAYLMIHHHLSLLSAIGHVQQKRWIFPNRGFLRQLISLDRKLQKEN